MPRSHFSEACASKPHPTHVSHLLTLLFYRRHPLRLVRLSLSLFLLAGTAALHAQALPDAPSATPVTDTPNPLPIVNGRHYRPPTQGEQLTTFFHRTVGIGAFGGPAITAAIQLARDRPDPRYWEEGGTGYGKRYGAAYGQRVIQAGTRYTLGAILHEDNRYLLCHGCTFKQKLTNALLADVTARHGTDGHRTISPTGVAAGFSGPLVAYAFWYPNQDPNFTLERGARNALIGFGTRPAAHFALEILDGRHIPLTHRHLGDNTPSAREQVPVGWTGPMPDKHRDHPEVADAR